MIPEREIKMIPSRVWKNDKNYEGMEIEPIPTERAKISGDANLG